MVPNVVDTVLNRVESALSGIFSEERECSRTSSNSCKASIRSFSIYWILVICNIFKKNIRSAQWKCKMNWKEREKNKLTTCVLLAWRSWCRSRDSARSFVFWIPHDRRFRCLVWTRWKIFTASPLRRRFLMGQREVTINLKPGQARFNGRQLIVAGHDEDQIPTR